MTGSRVLAAASLMAAAAILSLLLAEIALRALSRETVQLRGMYVEDPLAGIDLTPGFEGFMQTSEFRYAVHVNEHGTRGAAIGPRKPDTVRTMVMGDSFVFGIGVDESEALSKALERHLERSEPGLSFEVLNGGVPGYSPFQAAHKLRKLAPVFDPDLVVFVFFVGDDWFGNSRRAPPEEARRTPREWLRVHSALFRRFDRLVLSRLKSREQYAVHRVEPTDEFVDRMNQVLEILEGMRSTATAREAGFLIALNPRYSQVYPSAWSKASLVYGLGSDDYTPLEPNRRFSRLLEERGFWHIDLLDPLRREAQGRLFHFPEDGHWNESGHDFVAGLIAREVLPRIRDRMGAERRRS